ncbi:uncharacterized protein LOC113147427 [Cyclospora cayetanensis]|uniref:Uncharacterized protein LOC113147427 n=1 Tax=Cyclospora cayetanensis TaxID=88456 RepID=A0A6P6S2A5_9EIME|nr:uncharacterized protein LOC113147427 [Cyclospora cayetanensis]
MQPRRMPAVKPYGDGGHQPSSLKNQGRSVCDAPFLRVAVAASAAEAAAEAAAAAAAGAAAATAEALRIQSPLFNHYLLLRLCSHVQQTALQQQHIALLHVPAASGRSGGSSSKDAKEANDGSSRAAAVALWRERAANTPLPAVVARMLQLLMQLDRSSSNNRVLWECYAAVAPTLLLLVQPQLLERDLTAASFRQLPPEQKMAYRIRDLLSSYGWRAPLQRQQQQQQQLVELHEQPLHLLELQHDELLLQVVFLLLLTSHRLLHWQQHAAYERQRPAFRRPGVVLPPSAVPTAAAAAQRRGQEWQQLLLSPASLASACGILAARAWFWLMDSLQEGSEASAVAAAAAEASPTLPQSASARLAAAAGAEPRSWIEAPAAVAVFLGAPLLSDTGLSAAAAAASTLGGPVAAVEGGRTMLQLLQLRAQRHQQQPTLVLSDSPEAAVAAVAAAWRQLQRRSIGSRLRRMLWTNNSNSSNNSSSNNNSGRNIENLRCRVMALAAAIRAAVDALNEKGTCVQALSLQQQQQLTMQQQQTLQRQQQLLAEAANAAVRTPHHLHSFNHNYDDLTGHWTRAVVAAAATALAAVVLLLAATTLNNIGPTAMGVPNTLLQYTGFPWLWRWVWYGSSSSNSSSSSSNAGGGGSAVGDYRQYLQRDPAVAAAAQQLQQWPSESTAAAAAAAGFYQQQQFGSELDARVSALYMALARENGTPAATAAAPFGVAQPQYPAAAVPVQYADPAGLMDPRMGGSSGATRLEQKGMRFFPVVVTTPGATVTLNPLPEQGASSAQSAFFRSTPYASGVLLSAACHTALPKTEEREAEDTGA